MKQLIFAAMFALGLAPASAYAQAAAETDPLRACVTRSVTGEESVVTARWLFIAMSRHPSLPQTARVNDADGLEANRQMGALVNRLLFEACANETRAAVRASGREAAVNVVFGTLGEKAMTDLMGNPDVLASVIQLGAYVDRARFEALAQ
jgi:hypothetical protein